MADPLTQTDPFTQVFRALWCLLEDEADFTRLVPRGNRIKYDGDDRHPEKRKTITADFPEVRIVVIGGDSKLVDTSTATRVEQGYQIQMASGDRRFTEIFMPLKWAVIRALTNTKDNPANLGLPFVNNVEVVAVNDFPNDIEGRAMNMWAGMLDVLVTMYFDTSEETQTR